MNNNEAIVEKSTESTIQALAAFTVHLQFNSLSETTTRTAKQVILDAYGNILSGRFNVTASPVLAWMESLQKTIKTMHSIPMLGLPHSELTEETALFTYAALGRLADLDDGFSHAMGHPGSFLVPTLLSEGWLRRVSGCEAITAITAAYDIYARIGEVLNPSMHRYRGFDATGVCGPIAAAALISKLRGLDTEKTAHAMGLAATFSGGLIECQQDGTSGKYLCGSWAVVNGLRAVELAEWGLTGPCRALEGKAGLFQGFQGNSGYDASQVLTGLGQDFKINEIYFKRYACLRGVHATMDALQHLKETYGLTPSTVSSIDIRASSFLLRLSNPHPKTIIGAQGSLELTAAIILKYGKLDSEEFLLKCMKEPEIQSLCTKISVSKDQEMENYLQEHPTHFSASKVIVQKINGEKVEYFQPIPDGEQATSRFDWEMLTKKFTNLLRLTPYSEKSKDWISFLTQLEKQSDISSLLFS